MTTFFAVFYTMELAFKAHVNQGIIASLFSTSIVFSAVLFYFLYDEKLSIRHFIGLSLMIVAVVLISVGKTRKTETEVLVDDVSEEYLAMAVIFALLSGVILTLNGLVMRHYCKYIHISPL